MVALETLLTAVVSSISPGTMKSTVVLRSTADPLELMGLSQPGRPTARATRRRLCFDLGQVLNIVNQTHLQIFLPAARYEHAGLQVNFVSSEKRLFRDIRIK